MYAVNKARKNLSGLGDTSSFNFSSILSDAINAYSSIKQAQSAADIAKTQAQAQAQARAFSPPVFPGGYTTAYNPSYSPMYNGTPPSSASNLMPVFLIGGAGLVLLMLMKA